MTTTNKYLAMDLKSLTKDTVKDNPYFQIINDAAKAEIKAPVSKQLLQLATAMQAQFTVKGTAIEAFKQDCERAEEYSRDKYDIIPRLWVQAKSNIVQAMMLDMDLSQYQTESSLRKAKTALNKERKNASITVLPTAKPSNTPVSASTKGESNKAQTEARTEANQSGPDSDSNRVNPLMGEYMALMDSLPKKTQDKLIKAAMKQVRKEISLLLPKGKPMKASNSPVKAESTSTTMEDAFKQASQAL